MNEELDAKVLRARARVIILDQAFKVFVGVLLSCIFILLGVSYLSSLAARAEIRDCTTPQGECYQEQNRRSAELVENLLNRQSESLITVVKCARQTTTNPAFEKCVRDALEKQKKDATS